MIAGLKSNSQKIVHPRPNPFAHRRFDDSSPFSMTRSCVHKYLMECSKKPQRMMVTCGQSDEKLMISITLDEVSRETALKLADNKYFDAAFNLADNRKSLRKACEQAKNFYREHVLHRNPFPPKQRFCFVVPRPRRKKKEVVKTESVKKTESSLSLLEGTMSLTSMSSHSQLSATSPSHPINLKTPKKKCRQRIPDSQYCERKRDKKSSSSPAPPTSPDRPKTPKNENRLMNTFNTSG